METKVQLDQALAELDSLDQLDSQPVETAVATKESDIVSADETAVPIQRMEDDEFAGTMNQLNKFVGTIYEEFGNMSSSLKNVSNYFFEEADRWAEAAEKKDDSLFSDEGKQAIAMVTIGVAMDGFSRLVKAWEAKKTVQNYKLLCSKIVKSKGPYIDSMVNLADRAVGSAMEELNSYLDLEMDASLAYNSTDEFYTQKKMLMYALNRYRQAQFVFNQMIWLRDQMVAWQNGELEDRDSPVPSYSNINFNIFFSLHPYKDKAAEASRIEEIKKTCDLVVEEYKKMMNEEYSVVSPAFVVSLCDNELIATLLNNCSDETAYKLYELFSDFSVAPQKNAYIKELLDSEALSKAFALTVELGELKSRADSHTKYLFLNGVLLSIAACFPVVAYSGWGWWNILPCILIVGVIGFRTLKSGGEVAEKYEAKIKLLSLWRDNCILEMTGHTPGWESVTDINNKIWRTIVAAIIGGIIGSFIFPIVGTILGVCLGAIMGDTDERNDRSNGGNYKSIKTGSYITTKVWTFIISMFVVLEIFGYFK